MAKSIGVLIRKNKNGNTFYCRLWYPPTKNSRNITLGKETEAFGSEQALERLNIIKDNFKQKNYNYKLILKQLDEINDTESNLSLNEVAQKYFDKKFQSIKTNFLNDYKDRFEFTDIKQLDDNPVFKKKTKHFKTFRNYYRNHLEVEEWIYEQQKTIRENTPKQKLTKIGVKKYSKLGLTRIVDISKQDIETWMEGIQKKINLQQKTKHNLISQLKTIFNFAVDEEYLEKSPFEKIKKEQFTKNPHNYRERLLDKSEMNQLLLALKKLKNQNSFNASLLGLSTGARVNSVLNMRKSDFLSSTKEFHDYYTEIEIINFKTQNVYTLPLVKAVGKYFYYLLRDWEDDEYVLRPMSEDRRFNKPMVELPSDFRETTDRTVNASEKVYELYDELQTNLGYIDEVSEYSKNAKHYIKQWKERNTEITSEIKQLKKVYLADKKNYLKTNFSFHNFRHQLVSLTSVYNPLYAKRILNHSSSRTSATTDRYIKSDINKIREILEKALSQYVEFLEPFTKELSNKYNYDDLKNEFEFVNYEKPIVDAYFDRKDVLDINLVRLLLSDERFSNYDFNNMTVEEIKKLESIVMDECYSENKDDMFETDTLHDLHKE